MDNLSVERDPQVDKMGLYSVIWQRLNVRKAKYTK